MIPLDDRGLLLGDGLFETLLAVDGRLVCWREHLDRLAAEVDFTQPTDAWDDYYPGLKDVYAAPDGA